MIDGEATGRLASHRNAHGRYVQPRDEDQAHYSRAQVAFVAAHLLEYESAWLNPGAATRAILARLEYERFHLKHSRPACMCWCEGPRHRACEEWRLTTGGYGRESNLLDDVGRELGRTSPVHAPMPDSTLLDLARASARRARGMGDMVRFLNGEMAA